MRVLIASLLFPLPTNVARGTFVADHAELLKQNGHDIRVLNPLPRLKKYFETGYSTLHGVSKAPKFFEHGEFSVFAPRYWDFPDHPYPRFTAFSMRRRVAAIEKWLGNWRPEVIVSHTLWPCASLAVHLARRWGVPVVGVVHGHDLDVGINAKTTSKAIKAVLGELDHLVTVSDRLEQVAQDHGVNSDNSSVIPCHVEVGKDWAAPMKKWRGRWRKDKLDILFPADSRRPEKNHILALKVGEELEQRGWVVGITNLKQQPRSIVWDRMMVAQVTLITSKRESGPLVAKESILCGTPVVSVDVGDVSSWLNPVSIAKSYQVEDVADAIEATLQYDWAEDPVAIPSKFTRDSVAKQWNELLNSLKTE